MTHLVVIGHTGQVASELCATVLPSGWHLTSLGRQDIDLSQPGTIASKLEPLAPSVLINAAAYTAVDKAETEEELAMQVNGHAPGELARTCVQFDIPLLHVSTDYVFDGTATEPYSEQHHTHPLNAYGRSKLAGEVAIQEPGARAIILRTSWVFSATGANFVKTMLRLAAERDELSIVADQRGGPTSAKDLASTLITLAQHLVERPQAPSGIYHYAGQPGTNWAEFAAAIFEGADWLARKPQVHRISTEQYPTPAKRPLYSVLDCSKINRDHAIQQPDWCNGLRHALDQLNPGNRNNEAP